MTEVTGNSLPVEFNHTQDDVRGEISTLLTTDVEGWKEKWSTDKFNTMFPSLVKTLIFDQGETYSASDRAKIFTHGLMSILSIPWGGYAKDEGMRCLRAKYFGFSRDGNVTFRVGDSQDSRSRGMNYERETLTRAQIASLILLGMSLPNEAEAMGFLNESYNNSSHARYIREMLDSFVFSNSPTRGWVKANNLDIQTTYEWDKQIAELILNAPENQINPTKNSPKRLPAIMRAQDMPGNISPASVEVFIDYVLQYVDRMNMNDRRSIEVIELIQDLRRMPDSFLKLPSTHVSLQILYNAARPGSNGAKTGIGSGTGTHEARFMLPNTQSTFGALRWLPKGVTQLLE